MKQMKQIDPKEFDVSAFGAIGDGWFLITAKKKDGTANTMTAQWGGMGFMWGRYVAYIVIRPTRYTREFVDEAGRFSMSFLPGRYKQQMTYLGTVSGRDEAKIEKSGLALAEIDGVPCFEEARYIMLCKTLYAQEMKEECFAEKGLVERWFPQRDFHTLYVAEVEKLLVEE